MRVLAHTVAFSWFAATPAQAETVRRKRLQHALDLCDDHRAGEHESPDDDGRGQGGRDQRSLPRGATLWFRRAWTAGKS
jgi:hypothetical protein